MKYLGGYCQSQFDCNVLTENDLAAEDGKIKANDLR